MPSAPAPAPAYCDETRRDETILVVEDNAEVGVLREGLVFLQKPFSPGSVTRAVRSALS